VCYTDATPDWLKVLIERRIDLMSQEALHGGFVSLWDDTRGIAYRPSAGEYLARRSCPVLAIHTIRPLAELERSTFSDVRSRAVDWEGTGHWLQVERPLDFANAVIEWTSQLGPG
jgi:pimeloyl-ACP methyl ester carboxylesterase